MADEKKTAYHVLKLIAPEVKREAGSDAADSPEQWSIAARGIEAHNAEAAVKQHVEGQKDKDKSNGLFVGVPSRSWRVTPITVETQTVVKVGARE